jgi:hypothetical protein
MRQSTIRSVEGRLRSFVFRNYPWVWVIVFLNVLAIANIPRAIHRRQVRVCVRIQLCDHRCARGLVRHGVISQPRHVLARPGQPPDDLGEKPSQTGAPLQEFGVEAGS